MSQRGIDVSYQQNWSQQFNNQYAHDPILFQDHMQYANPNWQMSAVGHGHPSDDQHYRCYSSGYSQLFPHQESNNMMYPNHQLHNGTQQGYHHHPSWSSLVSSTGSIGSVGSSGHSCVRRRSTKKHVKKNHHHVVHYVETHYDGDTLLSMKGKFRHSLRHLHDLLSLRH